MKPAAGHKQCLPRLLDKRQKVAPRLGQPRELPCGASKDGWRGTQHRYQQLGKAQHPAMQSPVLPRPAVIDAHGKIRSSSPSASSAKKSQAASRPCRSSRRCEYCREVVSSKGGSELPHTGTRVMQMPAAGRTNLTWLPASSWAPGAAAGATACAPRCWRSRSSCAARQHAAGWRCPEKGREAVGAQVNGCASRY